MDDRINLADPDFEPTDEQLKELSRRAFAGVQASHEIAMAQLRAGIELASAATLKVFAERIARLRSGA